MSNFLPLVLSTRLAAYGYAIVAEVAGKSAIQDVLSALTENQAVGGDGAARKISGGKRNLLANSLAVRRLAQSRAMRELVTPSLGKDCFAVRAILFDKTPESNWKVPWHQDLTIAVRERLDTPGFGQWTFKEGVNHVQPPTVILQSMLSVRLHLDDCGPENGPLRVLPGTHFRGRLDAPEIQRLRGDTQPEVCVAAAGDVVLMHPLLLHASSAATSPAHRRVIHIDYAAGDLPSGLEWYERYPLASPPR